MDLLKRKFKTESRRMWANHRSKIRALEAFGYAEGEGGRRLREVAELVIDPELKSALEHHAEDEFRHANLFRMRADELRAALPAGDAPDESSLTQGPEPLPDIVQACTAVETEAHGDSALEIIDELGEIAYLSLIHEAEKRAADAFRIHSGILRESDPKTAALFADILGDENAHVRYTADYLERWRAKGYGTEIDLGLAAAKKPSLLTSWKALGLRAASHFGHVLMFLFYYSLALPFGLLARSGVTAHGWSQPIDARGLEKARSQY